MPGRVLLLRAACGLTVAFWVAALSFQVPYIYSAGDTATWAYYWRHGVSVYSLHQGLPLTASNYPPLFLALVATLAPHDELLLVTGSVIAMLGFALTLYCVWKCGGAYAALLLTGNLQVAMHASACLPDTLGLGLVSAGTACATLAPPGWPLWSGLLFAAGLLCKHNLIALPAGTFLWALVHHPRQALWLAGVTLAVLGPALGSGLAAPLVVWSWAPWSVGQWLRTSVWVLPLLPALWLVSRHRLPLTPWKAGLLASLPWLLALGRLGSAGNYTLELATALSVLVAACPRGRGHLWLWAFLLTSDLVLTAQHGQILPTVRREQDWVKARLANSAGPVYAESTWYSTAAGRPPVVIPFLARQLDERGLWSAQGLRAALERGEIPDVLLGFEVQAGPLPPHQERLPAGVLEVVAGGYELVGQAGQVYHYRPRGAALR